MTSENRDIEIEFCQVDKKSIRTMIFKGTGVCCESCRKIRDLDTSSYADIYSTAPKPEESDTKMTGSASYKK